MLSCFLLSLVLIMDVVVFTIEEGVFMLLLLLLLLLLVDVVYGLRFSFENSFSFNNGPPELSVKVCLSVLGVCFLLL